ncbi:hypothetical protein SLE2022_005810 [Rubroshorea leprosula]
MASMTMTASLLPTSSSALTKLPSTTARRGLVVVRASSEKASLEVKNVEMKKEESSGRRELFFAAAAAAACSIAKVAMAGEEPKPGTPEAKKKYGPICVTMPTARICHK